MLIIGYHNGRNWATARVCLYLRIDLNFYPQIFVAIMLSMLFFLKITPLPGFYEFRPCHRIENILRR